MWCKHARTKNTTETLEAMCVHIVVHTKREQSKHASIISQLDALNNKQQQQVEWAGSLCNRLFKASSIANKVIEFQAGSNRFPKICAFPTEICFMKSGHQTISPNMCLPSWYRFHETCDWNYDRSFYCWAMHAVQACFILQKQCVYMVMQTEKKQLTCQANKSKRA